MSELAKFKAFLNDKSMTAKQKTQLLRQYAMTLGMTGTGKSSGKKLVPLIIQGGGSWSSFTNWVRGAANTVANTAKSVGNAAKSTAKTVYKHAIVPGANAVYKHAIVPGINYVKEKPITAIGGTLGALGYIPSPFSPILKTAGAATTALGSAVGKGSQSGGNVSRNVHGKPIMLF